MKYDDIMRYSENIMKHIPYSELNKITITKRDTMIPPPETDFHFMHMKFRSNGRKLTTDSNI